MNNIESSPGDPEVMAACGDLIILTCSVEITNRNADWMARFAGILKVTKEFCWFRVVQYMLFNYLICESHKKYFQTDRPQK